MYCKSCGSEFVNENAEVCLKCGTKKGNGDKFCAHCGAEVKQGQDICLNCGFRISGNNPDSGENSKSKLTAGLLGIFLGAFGVHNFYLGYTTKAIIQLCVSVGACLLSCCTYGLTSWFVIPMGIWGLIEGIMILTGHTKKDGKGNLLND